MDADDPAQLPLVYGTSGVPKHLLPVRKPAELVGDIVVGGHGIVFDKAREISERLVLAVLRSAGSTVD
jgi:hypothetical protein